MGDHDAPTNLLGTWRDTQPVRLYLYGLTVPVLGLAVTYGWVTEEKVGPWLAVAGALFLATAGGTELARRVAWSPHSVDTALDTQAEDSYRAGMSDGQLPDWQAAATRQPATTAIAAIARCRRVQDGLRCLLPAHPEAVPHKYE